MKHLFGNHLENAIEALRANRLRTGLTIVGVTIGVACITMVLSLTSSVSHLLSDQFIKTSDLVALVRSGVESQVDHLLRPHIPLTANTLTEKDANDLADTSGITAAPMALIHTNLSAGTETVDAANATLIGSTGNLQRIANLKLQDGEFIDSANGIVIGHQLSIDLFGTEGALGSILKVRGQNLTVIGVLQPTHNPINYLGVDFDRSAILPLTVAKQFTGDTAQIQQIVLKADNATELKRGVQSATKTLSINHKGDHDFHIVQGSAITAPNGQFVDSMSLTIAIIAGISLLVGGIGIMNIMLVNVAERQREIGIRKAIGATNHHIINQFLIESAIIGLIGGVVGYAIGLAAAFGLSLYLPIMPEFQWQVAILVTGLAVCIGVVFGIYPAAKAAKKDPIESLRQ